MKALGKTKATLSIEGRRYQKGVYTLPMAQNYDDKPFTVFEGGWLKIKNPGVDSSTNCVHLTRACGSNWTRYRRKQTYGVSAMGHALLYIGNVPIRRYFCLSRIPSHLHSDLLRNASQRNGYSLHISEKAGRLTHDMITSC